MRSNKVFVGRKLQNSKCTNVPNVGVCVGQSRSFFQYLPASLRALQAPGKICWQFCKTSLPPTIFRTIILCSFSICLTIGNDSNQCKFLARRTPSCSENHENATIEKYEEIFSCSRELRANCQILLF